MWYLFHCADSVHLVDFGSQTFDLDTDVRALFDNLLTVVSPLRRCRVGVECDFSRYHLPLSVTGNMHTVLGRTYVTTDESLQRTAVHKEASAEHRCDDAVHLQVG
jgi:hypothetical protein